MIDSNSEIRLIEGGLFIELKQVCRWTYIIITMWAVLSNTYPLSLVSSWDGSHELVKGVIMPYSSKVVPVGDVEELLPGYLRGQFLIRPRPPGILKLK